MSRSVSLIFNRFEAVSRALTGRRTMAACAGIVFSFIPAAAADQFMQIECGAIDGKTFYQENSITSESEAGWVDEDLPGGTLHELNMDTRQVEYRFKDAAGAWRSSTDRGGQTSLLNINQALDVSHITFYADGFEVEIIQLTNLQDEKPKITFTAVKNGSPFTLARIFKGECSPPVFYER